MKKSVQIAKRLVDKFDKVLCNYMPGHYLEYVEEKARTTTIRYKRIADKEGAIIEVAGWLDDLVAAGVIEDLTDISEEALAYQVSNAMLEQYFL